MAITMVLHNLQQIIIPNSTGFNQYSGNGPPEQLECSFAFQRSLCFLSQELDLIYNKLCFFLRYWYSEVIQQDSQYSVSGLYEASDFTVAFQRPVSFVSQELVICVEKRVHRSLFEPWTSYLQEVAISRWTNSINAQIYFKPHYCR